MLLHRLSQINNSVFFLTGYVRLKLVHRSNRIVTQRHLSAREGAVDFVVLKLSLGIRQAKGLVVTAWGLCESF